MGSKWSKESIEYSRKAEQVCNNYLMYLTGHTNNQWFSTLTQSADLTELIIHQLIQKIELQ